MARDPAESFAGIGPVCHIEEFGFSFASLDLVTLIQRRLGTEIAELHLS
jgi:hypothetical protein